MTLMKRVVAASALVLFPLMTLAQQEAPKPPPKHDREILGLCKFWDNDFTSVESGSRGPECIAKFRWCDRDRKAPGVSHDDRDCRENYLRVTCDHHHVVFYGTADADEDGKVTLTGDSSAQFPVPPVLRFENPKKVPTKVKAWLDVNQFNRKLSGSCKLKEAEGEKDRDFAREEVTP